MKKTKRILSMLVVLGIFVSMLSGISVSAAEPFEYDLFVDGWRTEDGVTNVSQIELGGHGDVIKSEANYGTTLIASAPFSSTLRNTTVVFSFKFMSEKVTADPEYTISQMYVKNSMVSAQEMIDNGANMPAFVILGNGDFGYYSDPGIEGENAWNNLVTPEAFKGYGQWNTWYQIDCIYDLTNGKVNYYVDGIHLGEGNGPNALNYIMFVPNMEEGLPRGNTYYDDITVREIGEFITLSKDDVNSTENTVAVKFSEPIISVEKLKLYDVETLEAVNVNLEKIDEFTYSFDIKGLKYGAEYKISVPAGAYGLYGNTTKASNVYFNIKDKTIIQNESGEPYFEDNFSYNSTDSMFPDENAKWEKDGVQRSGANAKVDNDALRLDLWRYTNGTYTGAKTNMDESVTDGTVEFLFDASQYNPADNVTNKYNCYFEFGLFDTAGTDSTENWHPVMQIQGEEVRICTNMASTNTTEAVTFENANDITKFTSYKVVLDMDANTAKVYAHVDNEYTEIGSTTINDTLISRGINEAMFRMVKITTGTIIAESTSAKVDNFKVYIKDKATVPVVRSVRFDGKGASDNVVVATNEIKIYFNTEMDEDTLGDILIDSAVYSGAYSADENAYVITVSSLLKNTDYIINVPTTVKSADGIALGREYNGVFHTEEGAFGVTSFTLKKGSDDATYADTEVGDTLTAAVTITNEEGRTGSYVLIYAVYDGNQLAQTNYVSVPFDAENETSTKDISFVIPETKNDLNVKVMLWESLLTLKPIERTIVLD